MWRQKMTPRIIITLVVAFLTMHLGCSHEPKRPANVPIDAVFVPGSKRGWWHSCRLGKNGECLCTIYHLEGDVLRSGVFLPYEGDRPTKATLIVTNRGSNNTVELST